jgi:beta-N-acetylhexosaminidase
MNTAIDFRSLSLREKLAQLIFVRIGSNLPPVRTVEEDVDRVAELLTKVPLGGLLVFNGQCDQTSETLQRLQSISRIPLLVGADIERGIGQQLRGYTLFPHAMAFDALGSEAVDVVHEFARLTGLAARAHGVHISFSPVADVNIDPKNPIISTRSFGNDPTRSAELVAAYARGAKSAGLLSTAKHFPGHGNTHEDSHHELPTVHSSIKELHSCELVPFQSAIDAGAELIMTAHVTFPALDDTGTPATLSKPILTTLLRNEMKFSGAVVSDSLLMDGVAKQYTTEGEMAVQALLAGVDILLDIKDPHLVLDEMEKRVNDGQIPHARVDEALARVQHLKTRVFTNPPELSPARLSEVIQQSEVLAKRVAHHSIQVIDSVAKPGLKTDQEVLVVMLRPHQTHLDPAELPFGQFMRLRFSQCKYLELKPSSTLDDYATVLSEALDSKQTVVAMVVKPAAWHRFGLLPEQDHFVRELISQRDFTLASLGSPVPLEDYPDAACRVCAFSDVFVSQEALADFLSAT